MGQISIGVDILSGLLPDRPYGKVLDLGSGHGFLARRLSVKAEEVLGVDISQVAVDQAKAIHSKVGNLSFLRADVLDLPATLDGRFDVVVVADMLYYLPKPLDDRLLKDLAQRIARLLVPGGLGLVVNRLSVDPPIHVAAATAIPKIVNSNWPANSVVRSTTSDA